jgi:hypothetical protein
MPAILENMLYIIGTDRAIMCKNILFPVVGIQPACRAYPQTAGIIFHNAVYIIADNAVFVVGAGFIHGKPVSVVFIEPFIGCKPHKAFAVFEDGAYMALRKTIVGSKSFKFGVPALRKAAQERSLQKKQEP